ncbi:MAG: ribose 5-phosphate isomerase B [Chlorobi bacterium]|nr:ribose 5-phosphate isomerase B [Chlorobiota bacterium]
MDIVREHKLTIKRVDEGKLSQEEAFEKFTPNDKTIIAIGSDHTGYQLKGVIAKYLSDKGFGVLDCGTFSEESCDYPDFANEVAQKVVQKQVRFGVMIDATGIPSAITANKIAGIRAATCYNEFSAKSAREHNNANMLVLGAKTLGEETIKSIVDKWIATDFAGGRHQRRLDKITAIEKRIMLNKFK